MNSIHVDRVFSKKLIAITADLADEIWHQHYSDIIGTEQIDYMLGKYQTVEAISKQITDGMCYCLISFENQYVGYMAYQIKDDGSVFLSKIYVLDNMRGKGLGRKLMEYAENEGKNNLCNRIWLTVNRGNENSVAAYKSFGFTIEREIDSDIGNGFLMNDYVMFKVL